MKVWLLIFMLGFIPPSFAMAPRLPDEAQKMTAPPTVVPEHREPLTLEQSYDMALRQSETVAIRKEAIEEAKAQIFKAAGEAIGDGSFVATDFLQEKQGNEIVDGTAVGGTFTRSERRERRFVFTQPLFQGFRTLGALSASGSYTKQRTQEWERARQLLFADVSDAFYDVIRLRKDVRILEEMRDSFSTRIKDLEEREKIGRSRASEIASTHVSEQNVLVSLAQSRGDLAIAEKVLEFLIGKPLDFFELRDEDDALGDEVSMPEIMNSITHRPDVEAAYQSLRSFRGNLMVAQSDLWPDISLQANHYEKREGFQSSIDWDLLFTIEIPLYRGGTTLGNVKEALSQWKQAKLAYQDTYRRAELDAKAAYQNWQTAKERYQALELSLDAAQKNYHFQQEDYSHNLVNNLEVLTAFTSYLDIRRLENNAFYEQKKSYWRMKIAKGDCCESA